MVYQKVGIFVQTSLLVNIHCNGSLVWCEASGFCHSISPGSSQTPFRYPVAVLCHGELAALDLQNKNPPLHKPQYFIRGAVGMGQLKAPNLLLDGS